MADIAVARKGRMSSKSIPEELLWLRPRAGWRSFLSSSCTVPFSSWHLQICAGGGIGHGSRDFKPDNEFDSEELVLVSEGGLNEVITGLLYVGVESRQ